MSFFYLCPAKGTIPFHVLEIIVIKRLEHLIAIVSNSVTDYNEFVIEGSIYDNVGHYTLCIAAILSQDSDVYNFVLNSESVLFTRRVELLSSYDLRSFARKLLKHIRKNDLELNLLKPLQYLCHHIGVRHISQHLKGKCNDKCTLYNIDVNFVYCLQFISQRCIELNNGIGTIPCNKWIKYLVMLFTMNLKQRLFNTNLDNFNCDSRIHEILNQVKSKLFDGKLMSPNIITSAQVDDASINFPPCMLNLHLHLRTKHRLSHEQRFNYSLFLKDIGMPLYEAVEFWKAEYSKNPAGHSCCHSWAADEKKFLYGIRHMYGLEGRRKSYSCRSCNQIRDLENSNSEGGCPFKSFDSDRMQKLMKLNENLMSQIYELKIKQQYSRACLFFLENKHKRSTQDNKVNMNLTPVKYFQIAVEK